VSSTLKTVTSVLLAVWIVSFAVFLIKFNNFVNHPIAQSHTGGAGGIFLAISQAALGAAVILIWRLRGKEA
jgi:hypothetical protein